METIIYYLFLIMMLGGALGVILMPSYVNAAMSMLVSMLGVAGMMLMMGAFFPAFVMVTVYAGAVLVLFVFVVMLIGDVPDNVRMRQKICLLILWVGAGVLVGLYSPMIAQWAASQTDVSQTAASQVDVLGIAKNYGFAMFKNYMLPFQIVGMLLLAAMVGVIVIAKEPASKKRKRELV